MSKEHLHIALVSNTSWSIYNFRVGLVRALIAAGHHVYAIAPRDDYSDKLTAAGASYISLNLSAHSTGPHSDIKTFLQLFSIYRKFKFDQVIHYTIKINIYGSMAAKLCRINSIAIVTGLGRTFQFQGFTQKIVTSLYRIAAICSDELWFLNEENRDQFVSKGIVRKKKTFILPSEGVNTSRFRGVPLSQKKHKSYRILFAGRLLKDKGIFEFVTAAKAILREHKFVKFEIVGFVNPKNPMSVSLDLMEEWQREGWINYLGSHEDIRPFINRSDCIVFPSYYQEGISRILLEAASMSRPIITTDQTGCREVVDHNKNGFLVPPKAITPLVDAISRIIHTPIEDLELMGAMGRDKVKHQFDERQVIGIYFQKLLNKKSTISSEEERKKQINEH